MIRKAILLALFALGLAAQAAVLVQQHGPVRVRTSGFEEGLQALRVNRSAPAKAYAKLFVRADEANFWIDDPAGITVLKCPLRGDLPGRYASYATSRSAPGCEAEAFDDPADVRIYDLAGKVSPPLPGTASTLAGEELQAALYLPALQPRAGAAAMLKPGRLATCAEHESNCALSLSVGTLFYCGELRDDASFQGRAGPALPDDVAVSLYAHTQEIEAVTATTAARFVESPPWGNAGPGAAEMAHDTRAFFAKHPRGVCFYLSGLDVERPHDAQLAARALAFPVFGPFDPLAPDRATPLLRDLQLASRDDQALASLFSRCDLPDEQACRDRRERAGLQLRSALGKLQPPLEPGREELALHVASSGPFQLKAIDPLRIKLESKQDVVRPPYRSTGGVTVGAHGKLVVRYQPLSPSSFEERKKLDCPAVCLFHAPDSSQTMPPDQAEAARSPGYLARLAGAQSAK